MTFRHSVRARLASGWHEQPCDNERQAVALFGRLLRYQGVHVERLDAGRTVEIRTATAGFPGLTPAPG